LATSRDADKCLPNDSDQVTNFILSSAPPTDPLNIQYLKDPTELRGQRELNAILNIGHFTNKLRIVEFIIYRALVLICNQLLAGGHPTELYRLDVQRFHAMRGLPGQAGCI
jgi:hypothetical protein